MVQLSVTIKNKSKAISVAKTLKAIEGVENVELISSNEDEKELEELDKRWNSYLKNKSNVTTWESTKKKIAEKYGL